MAKQRLNLDIESLFPGEVINIGGIEITINPLNIEQISSLSKQLESIISNLTNSDISWETIDTDRSSLVKIAIVIIDKSPNVLSEIANIEMEDLLTLPLSEITKILSAVIKVNVKSKDDLIKNFKSLIAMLPKAPEELTQKKTKK